MKGILRLALAATLLTTPHVAAAQVLSGDQVSGSPGAIQGTASDGKRIKLPTYVPVRPDGTVIDPAGGGGGASVPTGTAGSPNAAVVSVQGVSGGTPQNVTVTNPTATGLTDTQLRASAVPVSGPLTDAQLRATSVPVAVATALPTGANTIGSIANTAFGISGSLPAGTNSIGIVTSDDRCVYNATFPSPTSGTASPLQCGSRGSLRVELVGGGGSVIAAANTPTTAGLASANGIFVIGQNMVYDTGQANPWRVQQGTDVGTYTLSRGLTSIATGQVSVGTTATLVAAARVGRGRITVNVGAANTCAFGNSGVASTSGYPLQPVAGASTFFETGAAIYAVCSATTTVGFVENF